MSTTTTTKSAAARWRHVFRDLRREGIDARRNVMACCRSCFGAEQDPDAPLVWTYGGQGMATSWVTLDGAEVLVYRGTIQRSRLTGDVVRAEVLPCEYLYWGGDESVPALAVEILRRHGFEATWSGDRFAAIEVTFEGE